MWVERVLGKKKQYRGDTGKKGGGSLAIAHQDVAASEGGYSLNQCLGALLKLRWDQKGRENVRVRGGTAERGSRDKELGLSVGSNFALRKYLHKRA